MMLHDPTEWPMTTQWLAAAAALAIASTTGAIAGCGSACTRLAAAESPGVPNAAAEDKLKGYDITSTGLRPRYPKDYACSALTSLYASWIDVDRTRRDEHH